MAEVAAMYNFTNRMAMATNMLPNEEYSGVAPALTDDDLYVRGAATLLASWENTPAVPPAPHSTG